MTISILYFTLTGNIYGGEKSLLTLVSNLSNKYRPIVAVPEKGRLTEELEKRDIPYIIYPLLQPAYKIDAIPKFLKAITFLKKNRVSLIHFNSASYWKPMEIPAARLLGIPVITHCRILTRGSASFLRYSNKIIANSKFTLKTIPYDQAEVVYNCVNLRAFDDKKGIRSEIGLSPNDVVVSFIGRLIEEKGVESFAALAKILKGKAKFLIAGDAMTDEYLKKIMDMITDDVIYVGYRKEIEDIYMTSDIIIVPSQWEEPFGRICIEAGAARKPVVATRVGGIPEIVEHGVNGFLVEKDDLDAMVKFTQELIDNAQLREEMGKKGRKLVEEKFSISTHVREIERIYGEFL